VSDRTCEETLVDFAAGLRLADIPDAVLSHAKGLLLDQFGIQLACRDLPWVAQVRDYVVDTAKAGPCTVVGTSERLNAEAAALVNGTAGHAFEADDYCPTASAHPGCVVSPPALALAQAQGSTGEEMLLAFVAGAETVIRLARATMPSMLYERGFHETCAHGVFGSAVASARLLGLSREQAVNALGIAGSHASGTTEFTRSGGDVKRLHGGLGAAGGVRGALLAQRGFTGPSRVLGGERGFLHSFSPKPAPEWLVDGLGEDWQLLNVIVKPYCCAGRIIPEIDALKKVVADSGITAADVATIRVGADRGAFVHGVSELDGKPIDAITAQFSNQVGIALAMVKGRNDFTTYHDLLDAGGLHDPVVIDLAKRVELYVDEQADRAYPGAFDSAVTVLTKDGRELTARAIASRDHAPDFDRIVTKFTDFASTVLPADRVAALVREVSELATAPSTAALTDLLTV
jgi:2-methylcitrate dehydratase PrpD